MRQPLSEFDDMPVSEIEAYVKVTTELLKAEAGPVTRDTENDFT